MLLSSDLPLTVTNVQVAFKNSSSVNLLWDVPEHSVDVYQVQLLRGNSIFKQVCLSAIWIHLAT